MSPLHFRPRNVVLPTTLALSVMALAACGGGGSSGAGASADTSSADSATASLVPAEAAQTMGASMATAQALVASSTSGSSVSCPGGGTASYTLSGTGATDNKVIESGEDYVFNFQGCKGASGAIAVTGTVSLSVTTVTAGTSARVVASLTLAQLRATLPLSTITLDGAAQVNSSFLYRSGSSAGSSLDSSLTASGVSVTRATASRAVSYAVNAMSLNQLSQFDGSGAITSSQVSGSATLSTTRPAGAFSASLAMQSAVTFSGGIPTSGQWTVTLPASLLTVSASSGSVAVALDLGKNGSVDLSHTFVPGTWASSVE